MLCRALQLAASALFVLASVRSVADGLPNKRSAGLASLPASSQPGPSALLCTGLHHFAVMLEGTARDLDG